ncbi:hypothetical protein BKA70DRAFT_598917 [Coprinopsis sp. MPI-PUGE-AT-0042]|nr:hypothetical protein BKA70DRAFT_598917 [Coprinopsis sp. MPI-PUGE-AT-0042]
MEDNVSVEEGGDFQQSMEEYEDQEIHNNDELGVSDAELAKLFRRIKFEVTAMPSNPPGFATASRPGSPVLDSAINSAQAGDMTVIPSNPPSLAAESRPGSPVLDSAINSAQAGDMTAMPSNPPSLAALSHPGSSVLNFEIDGAQVTGGMEAEPGGFPTTLLDDLDMPDVRQQPRALNGSRDFVGGLDNIYIKKIYPSGHGYPCPNPCPQGPPVRIGDVGELTSNGFITITNLFDCQIPALQSQLASVGPPKFCHVLKYLSEGESITGGVSVLKVTYLPGTSTIREIQYRCDEPQGAILAVTSPAELHTLNDENIRHLRLWLCDHGLELVQSLNLGRTENPLYVVTAKVTSSSWAIATYAEPMPESDNVLVLTHTPGKIPPYYWSEPGTAQTRSMSSSAVNEQGQRASDQCLFLRGYMITPESKDASGEPH